MTADSGLSGLRHRNSLLAAISPEQWEHLSRLTRVDTLEGGRRLDTRRAWFPVDGVISVLATIEDGRAVEVGLVGAEGMAGLLTLYNPRGSSWEYLVQMHGNAVSLPVADLRSALLELPELGDMVTRYMGRALAMVSQGVACNRFHSIEQRLARWLLLMRDRSHTAQFTLTHEFISLMVGAQRPSVSGAVSELRRQGLIAMRRGVVEIRDRGGLEECSCDCYAVMRDTFAAADDRP